MSLQQKENSDQERNASELSGMEDYLTPEQRVTIIADILSSIALRIVNESSHEEQ